MEQIRDLSGLSVTGQLHVRSRPTIPRRIPKPSHNPPQRHEQPPPLGQVVITRSELPAFRAFAFPTPVRLHGDLNAQFTPGPAQPDVAVHKPNEMLNPVQKYLNFQLHCWPLVSFYSLSQHRSETKVSFFFSTFKPGRSRLSPCPR